MRSLTCALLLQPADLGVQPPQRVGMVLLQEEQVLLSAVQLVFQPRVGRRHVGAWGTKRAGVAANLWCVFAPYDGNQ